MKLSQLQLSLIISTLLAVLAFMFHDELFKLSVNHIDAHIIQTSPSKPLLNNSFVFALLLLSIPIAHFFLSKVGCVMKTSHTLILIVSSIGFGCAFWWFRFLFLQDTLINFELPFNVSNTLPLSDLKLELYFWFGLIIGSLMSSGLLYMISKTANED